MMYSEITRTSKMADNRAAGSGSRVARIRLSAHKTLGV